jgi:peptide/nickel transport system substrate-binding protein
MRRTGDLRLLGGAVLIAVASLWLSATLANAGQRERDSGPSVLHATFASFPDYMDPQLSYTQEGWTAMYDTYIPLLTYRHAEGKAGLEVIPGLAKSLPKITDGGRTYTLFLRPGLRYSNGKPVHASDFEYAVKRLFRVNSGGSLFYADIVGAERFRQTGQGGISGIATDNSTGKIVIHLRRPRGTFTQELGLMFVAPVPPSTPMYDASFNPPPATGPYAIVESQPGIGWSYARNPAWSENGRLMPQLPGGHADRIEVELVRNNEKQVKGVEQGEFDWMENPPSALRYEGLAKKYGGTQFRADPTPNTYYFWMNTQKPPFDDLRVRRAVNYAVNADLLRLIYAHQLDPTHQIVPPDMPGYHRFDLYPHSMAKARRLIRRADPQDRRITVWTDTESPNAEAGEYYASVLRKLGFHARLKVVSADFYFSVIGNTSTPNLDTGWSDWFADYPHPNDWFQTLLAGSTILRTNNGNFAQIDVPSLNRKIASLSRSGLTPAGERRYAALDRAYMKLAPWVPYGTRVLSTFVSKRVDLGKVVYNPTFGPDLTSFQFR